MTSLPLVNLQLKQGILCGSEIWTIRKGRHIEIKTGKLNSLGHMSTLLKLKGNEELLKVLGVESVESKIHT